MKGKMTPMERRWVLYDVGNSAFTLLVSTLIPIFFTALSEGAGVSSNDSLAYWGYATSIATVLVALLGPTLGCLSDLRGAKRRIFTAALAVGAVCCAVLGFVQHWMWFLVLFVLAKAAYSLSLVVYDSMLCDVSVRERMDEVSSRGYAWGYIGSCAPFLVCLALYLCAEVFDVLPMYTATVLIFLVVAVWWVGCSLPLLFRYRQTHFVESGGRPVRTGMKNLARVFSELKQNKKVLFFLLAFFFFIDGVYTIIDMATAYGTSLGLDTTWLLLALLVTQIVAFPAAILLGMLSRKVGPERLIALCIVAYFCITVYAIFLDKQYEFWILAVGVGLFQGTIQAMSRSYFAKIIPHEKSGEYFGIYDIFGKGAAFMGTMLVSVVTQVSGSQNIGVGALAVMFVIGFVFFLIAVRCKAPAHSYAAITAPVRVGELSEAPAGQEGESD